MIDHIYVIVFRINHTTKYYYILNLIVTKYLIKLLLTKTNLQKYHS